MKINLPILYDQLSNVNAILVDCDIHDISLIQVRLFKKDMSLEKEYVYIIKGEEFDTYYDQVKNGYLIINGMPNRRPDRNAIIIWDALDEMKLFYQIQNIFTSFETWNQNVLMAILKQRDIVTLSKEIEKKLRNPIALFDLSFRVIGMAGNIPKKEKLNREWIDILENGLAPIESYNIPDNDIYFFAKHKREVYIPAGNPYGNNDLFVNIFVNHELFGIVAITNLLTEITLGEKTILTIVRDYYEQYFSLSFKSNSNYNVIHYYLQQLLDNNSIPFETLEYHLDKIHWKREGIFTLGCLCQNSGEYINRVEIEYAYSRIKKIINDVICFVYQNNIVVIQNNQDESIYSLENVIKKLDLRCGISFVFNNLKNIRLAYEQALISIEYGKKNKKSSIIWNYEDVYIDYLQDILRNQKDLLVYPMIKTLSEIDIESKNEYIKILKTYLLAGGNSKKAAEVLYMHRNTLLYKLEKIEDILNTKLSDLNEKTREIMLYSILIQQEK